MKDYTATDLIRLAKRYNNPRRSYLLVNPLQGKHLPTDPDEAINLFKALAAKASATMSNNMTADNTTVIGFAETAVAIGAVVACELNAAYLSTTREPLDENHALLYFSEEHSHAAEQTICADILLKSAPHTVVLVDDELTTGKTMRALVAAIRRRCPSVTRFIAASLVYRLGDKDEDLLLKDGIEPVYLLRPPAEDYEQSVHKFVVSPPAEVQTAKGTPPVKIFADAPRQNPRLGVNAKEYISAWQNYAATFSGKLLASKPGDLNRITVLGTEECMLPSLLIGQTLAADNRQVFCHATTRSPIGVCPNGDYPIKRGWRLASLYDENRTTYIYNVEPSDIAIIVSDAAHLSPQGMNDLQEVLCSQGCNGIVWVTKDDKHISK